MVSVLVGCGSVGSWAPCDRASTLQGAQQHTPLARVVQLFNVLDHTWIHLLLQHPKLPPQVSECLHLQSTWAGSMAPARVSESVTVTEVTMQNNDNEPTDRSLNVSTVKRI